jgi:hypothetical protein
MNDWQRILENEPAITPSPGFSKRVMRAIDAEVRAPAPIPFPWARMGLLLGLMSASVSVMLIMLPWPSVELGVPELSTAFASQANSLAWTSLCVCVVIGLARSSMRWLTA